MWTEISKREFASYIGEDAIEQFVESGELASECRRLLAQTWVCSVDNALAGFVVVIDDLIELLLVGREFQNRLVGKRLYKRAEDEISKGHDIMRVECFLNNARIAKILKRLGFHEDRTYQDEMGFMTVQLSKRC